MSKKIKITPQFLEEVRKGVENAGSRLQYAFQIDVAHTTVRDWLEGKTDHVRADVYSRVMNSGSNKNEKWRIGQVLRCIRKIKSLSAEGIENRFGISCQLIYGYEQGKYFPKEKNLRILCNALSIDRDIFYEFLCNDVSDSESFDIAGEIIRRSKEKKTAAISNENVSAPAPAVPEDPQDRLLLDAVREGVKDLTPAEKTILLRTIVNFTTQKTHREFYKCGK